ncbi:hypothetical protein [Fimbriiglobus ruber]|uniref:Uncharacterized protein n=1 Tax=Fimbriiglobus ruber TaxID=1908690 RepID=A0A225EGK2_9BACT|nr:hypothetical protein [Fimbriiglobus ruber]OWK47347.1 hypothetical protein FRUB_01046 [Fimbriiglobus ruber]
MSSRFVLPAVLVALLGSLAAVSLTTAQQPPQVYRDNFSGRDVSFVAGDANIKYAEKDHKLSDEHNKSARTSEYIKIEATPPAGATEAEFVHYYYETPPAVVTERMTASVWVKAYRAGVQIKARVVFPREKDPRNPDAPLTTLIPGEKYEKVRQWQRLGFGDPADQLKKHLPVLHARLGRAIDPTDAYVDRIVLNVYAGPGTTEVWVDDLEIGPTRGDVGPATTPGDRRAVGAAAAKRNRPATKAVPVEFADGQILVDGDPFFMLAIRHTNTPLHVLREAQFNTVWFPNDATPQTIEEAIRYGFWIVPTLPLDAVEWDARKPKKPDPESVKRDADRVTTYLRKFLSGDAVLMWDFGSGRTKEDLERVVRASDVVRTYDPRRPRAVDLWDGYQAYSSYVNAIGAHRWPLFSSLEMEMYREWLTQRRALTGPGKLAWTWVQTHLPDWYVQLLTGRPDCESFDDPIGPHPEQIRILTYLSIATGSRGLGFWSDKFLSNACHGRDRLLELALLNTEIEMIRPILFDTQDAATWLDTNKPEVRAALLRGPKELVVLPIWLGAGTQYTPPQATVSGLTIRVPMVPDGTVPWLVTAAGVSEIKDVKRVAAGTEIKIAEFDTTAIVVFTSDYGVQGKVVRWQDETRFKIGNKVAEWAILQAKEQYNKAFTTHQKIIAAGGPDIPEAGELFAKAKQYLDAAEELANNKQWDVAYREARRAVRPIRVLMRADWEKAVAPLDTTTASPYAVSFYSLPQHWQFAREVAGLVPGPNGFPHGGFELSRPAPTEGAAVASLPGWEVRKLILDQVDGLAAIINVKGQEDPPPVRTPPGKGRYAPQNVTLQPLDYRQPEFGQHCLRLSMSPKRELDKGGKVLPPPLAVERTVLAVDSPPATFPPGTIVRISFWVKASIAASADGVVIFDTVGGEPLGVRVRGTAKWLQYHLYRRIPASGKIAMTFAQTGLGASYIDDVKIEPMYPAASTVQAPAPTVLTPVGATSSRR